MKIEQITINDVPETIEYEGVNHITSGPQGSICQHVKAKQLIVQSIKKHKLNRMGRTGIRIEFTGKCNNGKTAKIRKWFWDKGSTFYEVL